jgi:hypothetical protein
MQLERAEDALRVMDQKAKLPGHLEHPHRQILRELIRAYLQATEGRYREAVEIVDQHWPKEIDVNPSVQLWAMSTFAAAARALQQDSEIDDTLRGQLLDDYGQRAVDVLRNLLNADEYASPEARKALLDVDEYSVFRDRTDFKELIEQP